MDIVPPVVVVDGLDVSFFRTPEEAGRALEGPDVLEGLYVAYDATGQPLDLHSEGGPSDYSARVWFSRRSGPPATGDLEKVLRDFLVALGESVPPEAGLDTLLARAIAKSGYRR